MINSILITAPTAEPVSLTDVRSQLSIRDDLSDEMIVRRIVEARQWAELHTGRSFLTQTWEVRLDCWPENNIIELPHGPVNAITTIKYLDKDGVLQTIANTDYKLATAGIMQRLLPAYGKTWPPVRSEIEAIQVRYTAGYGDGGESVPGPIREAILLTVGHWVEHQPAIESGIRITRIPFAVEHLLNSYRIIGV